jgi:hypothetical protein
MVSFDRQLKYQDHTRRYSILTTETGWEVREERDSNVVKTVSYHDWHRVERARRSITIELDDLQRKGWSITN